MDQHRRYLYVERPKPMRRLTTPVLLLLLLPALAFGQEPHSNKGSQGSAKPPSEGKIGRFDVTSAIFRDGISELSLKNVDGLHLGFEEIIRDKIQDDPRPLSPHFSLHLADKSVSEIIEALCEADARYTWSEDGSVDKRLSASDQGRSYLSFEFAD